MQISQVSSNNVAVVNNSQATTNNTSKTQEPQANQQSNRSLETDKVTISQQGQNLALQENNSDGDGPDVETVESNVTRLAEESNNGYDPKGATTSLNILA